MYLMRTLPRYARLSNHQSYIKNRRCYRYVCNDGGTGTIRIFSFIYVQWKFAFMSMGRPEYLQDSDVVYNRFQVLTSSSSLLEKRLLISEI